MSSTESPASAPVPTPAPLVTSSLETIKLEESPLVITGEVITGFQRGGKLLGCPTANIDIESQGITLSDNVNGIYFGWALMEGEVYKMVTSIGWNPHFQLEKKTVEPHLIHPFENDFYGKTLSIVVFGFLRPEQKYDSMDALIADIQNDIHVASTALDDPKYAEYKSMLVTTTTAPAAVTDAAVATEISAPTDAIEKPTADKE